MSCDMAVSAPSYWKPSFFLFWLVQSVACDGVEQIVAGFVWHRRHIAAKIRLKEVLDAQQEGYQVLQPAYDEALAAGVKVSGRNQK